MIEYPISPTRSSGKARIAPAVATGINTGVSIGCRANAIVAQRALPSVAVTVNRILISTKTW